MKYISITLFLIIVLFSCSDDNVTEPPSEFQFDESYGIIVTDTLYPVEEVSVTKNPSETGASTILSVGRNSEFEAYTLIRFSNVPADSIPVDSAVFELKGLKKFSLSGQSEMLIEIHELNEEWDSDVNTVETWRNYVPGTPYKTLTIDLEDSLTYKIELDNDLVSKWQVSENNFGLLLRAADMENQTIKEFGSFNTDLSKPLLTFIRTENDSSYRDSLSSGVDATVYKYTGTVLEEARQDHKLPVSSGFASRAYFKFDYTQLPQNAIVSNTNLVLSLDQGNEYNNPNKSENFYLRSLVEVGDDLTVDSTNVLDFNVNYILSERDGNIALSGGDAVSFGQSYFQGLVNRELTTEWFSVQYVGESSYLSLVNLYGKDATEGQPPMLIFRYLLVE